MTLEILTSDTLSPFRHGFFTRKGGASSGVFEGLNCGTGSSDQSEIVEINRRRVAEAMDAPIEQLVSIYQVHSPDVVTVDAPINGDRPKADAMVTNTPGLVLSILTADCQPVLFADHRARVVGPIAQPQLDVTASHVHQQPQPCARLAALENIAGHLRAVHLDMVKQGAHKVAGGFVGVLVGRLALKGQVGGFGGHGCYPSPSCSPWAPA